MDETTFPHNISTRIFSSKFSPKELVYNNSVVCMNNFTCLLYINLNIFFRFSASDVKTLRIYLGAHDIKSGSDGRTEHRVIRIIKHKDFNPKTLVNDIAILTLETPARISSTIRSVCLPSFHDNYDGQLVTVAGWGALSEQGGQPNVLHEVDVHVWTNSKCGNKYNNRIPGKIEPTMICAADDQRDSCSVS